MAKPTWKKNRAGGVSTVLRPNIWVTPAEYRWLVKKSKDKDSEYGGGSVQEVLFHLTKQAIDQAMLDAGEWCE